jgi:PAS domain S-box-containing protein
VALKKSELVLRESAQRLELAVRSGHLGVWDWDLASNAMVWDEEMLKLYGVTREQFTGTVQDWKQGLHPDDLDRAVEECQAALDGVRAFDTEFRVVQPCGDTRHVKADGLVLRDDAGLPVRMLGLNRDITVARNAEANYRMLFREMLDGFALHELICDAAGRPVDYRFLAVNPAFERMTGLSAAAVTGRTVLEVMPATERLWIERYGAVALTGAPCSFESWSAELCKHFEVTAFRPRPGQFACIFADVSARKKAEDERVKLEGQLRQSQKMEAVGRLAGGIAHDFNNMLGVILGYSEMTLQDLGPDHPHRNELEQIRGAGLRSAELTRQLLAFARRQAITPRLLDLNQTIEGMLKMLKRLLGEDISLSWRPQADLWALKMDPSQVDQLLANLCVNGRDAISGVGRLTIETRNCTFGAGDCAGHEGFVPGDFAQLVVSDDGCGMDSDTLAHLFEPFFTTKATGKGTGLGLATVYGIVKQNDGFIDVYSEQGRGTTFKVYLPRARGEASRAPAAQRTSPHGSETIMLVEDEPAILRLTTRMLKKLGYTVLSAGSPAQALRLAEEHPAGVHLLMTDVVMPGMNGRELADRLDAIFPGLKRLYMSGYTADVIARQGVLEEGVYFLQKPFSAADVATLVRAAIDGDEHPAGEPTAPALQAAPLERQ